MRFSGLALTMIVSVFATSLPAADRTTEALACFAGDELEGGAKDLYGTTMDGEQANYVYAQPNGPQSTMQAKFTVSRIPSGPQFVHMKARDDDFHTHTAIAIELNGKTLFDGANKFTHPQWQTQMFSIPDGTLKEGENTLTIMNREKEGNVGMPPWFQVAACVIGAEQYVIRRDLCKDFWITIPKETRPMPEPLAEGENPGFQWRGIKSWMWNPEQCMAEIPVLAKYKMNFFMNCYGAMCDIENYKWGDPNVNRWWEELPAWKKKAYEGIVRECEKNNITYCFSINPNLCSKRFVNSGKTEDIDALWQHYSWMLGLGVKWFNISLDDITEGIDAVGQAKVVNEIFRRLRAEDPQAQMIFCPTWYWGDGTSKEHRPYLETIAKELHKDVYVFWTGDAVVGQITRKGAETYRGIIQHRMFLWDNYPVNDAQPTMHLGPVMQRDADLCEVIDGYMSNPLCQQNEANRLPMLTCADYAWNPYAYDPERSIGQAIVHLAENRNQQTAMRDLVEAYAGMLAFNRPQTGFNSVLARNTQLDSTPHARMLAEGYIAQLEQLSARLKEAFPNSYQPEKNTLDNDIRIVKQKYSARYKD